MVAPRLETRCASYATTASDLLPGTSRAYAGRLGGTHRRAGRGRGAEASPVASSWASERHRRHASRLAAWLHLSWRPVSVWCCWPLARCTLDAVAKLQARAGNVALRGSIETPSLRRLRPRIRACGLATHELERDAVQTLQPCFGTSKVAPQSSFGFWGCLEYDGCIMYL